MSSQKAKTCLVSCSVLKEEIKQLVKQGDLDVDLVFVSKFFHVDYAQVEQNLRRVLEKTKQRYKGNIVLVYGDLCLGQNGEMKQFAEEHGVIKVDAVNCIDCLLGGKGKFLTVDPQHDLMFLSPGMTDFFSHAKDLMKREGVDEESLKSLFDGLRGIVLLDTLGNADELKDEIEKLGTGLQILETRQLGCENVKAVITEAMERNRQKCALKTA
jgi:RNase P protein component